MKKNSIIVGLSTILCLIIVSACTLDVRSEKTLHRPDVEAISGAILISGSYDSNSIEYINVFRRNADDVSAKPVNIGVIFPSGFDKDNKTYKYLDETAIEGVTYAYSCRLFEGIYGYYTTEEAILNSASDDPLKKQVPATSGLPAATYTSEDSLKCSSVDFKYNSDTHVLSLKSTPADFRPSYAKTAGKEYTDYCIVITNGTSTQSFLLSEKADDWSDKQEWNLQVLLPEAFFDTDIQILGLIAQRKQKSDLDDKVQRLNWTYLTDVTTVDKSDGPISDNIIRVDIQKGSNGTDYGYITD